VRIRTSAPVARAEPDALSIALLLDDSRRGWPPFADASRHRALDAELQGATMMTPYDLGRF
jgi:hypothetical protein